MDIEATHRHLQRLGQPFDIIISKGGLNKELYKNLEPTDVKGLIKEVIEDHSPDKLFIQERQRNGSTNIKKEKYEISMNNDMPGLNGLQTHDRPAIIPGDYKDYVILDLKEKNQKLENRCDKLEKENEGLKKENFELEKNVKFKDKEFELAIQKKDIEANSGLAGIVETVSTNPALATLCTTAIGRLMGMDVGQLGGEAPAIGGAENQPQSLNAQVAKFVSDWILKIEDEATVKQFFELSRIISQQPGLAGELLTMIEDEES